MKKISVFIQALVIALFGNSYYAHAQLVVSTTVTQNVSCYGGSNGSAMANVSSGTTPYTYSWLPGAQTNRIATGLSAANYTVHVQDVHGLTGTATASITQPTAPLSITATAQYTVVCPGAKDSLFASGSGGTTPYSYSWNAPYGDIIGCNSCARIDLYPDGNAYIVTAVNDMNGCTASASVSVAVHPFPYVTIAGPINPIAPGRSDTLVAYATGATTYAWSNSATTSTIIVSPSISTTYSITVHNTYGCLDTAHYTIDTDRVGTGASSTSAIRIVPSTTLNFASFSTKDSEVWFSFKAADSNNQIIANSAFLGMPVPHVHRLTLYNSSLQMIVDEPMPDIIGANQIRIDISHLHIGSTYYVRASRCPAHANMAGCNPNAAGECNPTQRWDFQMAFRTVPVFVPKDSGSESPSMNQLYYEDRGQISDLNDIPRFDIKAYTNGASPSVYASDSAVSFVYGSTDSMQRVDMVLTGSGVQPSQPVFKMEEDSNAGYLNYFKEFIENGVPQIEGYSRLVYKNVYSGVDMHVYSNNMGTKLYFVCNPGGTGGGGNPSQIELQFKGATSVSVNGSGGLNVVTKLGTLNFALGFAYTDSAGIIKPKSWHANFITVNSNTVRFNTGSFNTSEPLVIEVDRGHLTQASGSCNGNLCWSTYYGGTDGGDVGAFLAVCHDDSDNIYATGYTNSLHFPVDSGVVAILSKKNKGDTDVIIAKFTAHTNVRQWADYYGGSGTEIGRGIATDASGNAYITGSTNSTNLPQSYNSNKYHQAGGLNGNGSDTATDAFVATIIENGFTIGWASYYGGPGNESGHAIALDVNNNILVVGDGDTNTPLYKTRGAYYDSSYGTGLILKFTSSGVREWATLIGGDSTALNGVAVGGTGFYVTGASGKGYPIKGYYAFTYNAGYDAVITRFSNFLDTIVWSSYYGGDGKDVANGVVADNSGDVYITGHTYSPQRFLGLIPSTPRAGWAFDQDTNGNLGVGLGFGNAFIAEFVNNGLMIWGSYFGGVGDADGTAIALDGNGDVYITGYVNGANGFVWPSYQPVGAYVQNTFPPDSSETFIAAFTNTWNSFYYWGTYLCGTNNNSTSTGYGITAFNYQNLYVVGRSTGSDFQFVPPSGNGWFEQADLTSKGTSSIPFISMFNLTGITTGDAIITYPTLSNPVTVYPNPTQQNITVQMESEKQQNVTFAIYSLYGEQVYANTIKEPSGVINQEISLSSLPNGTYILKVTTEDNTYHQKIIKLQ